MKKRISEKVLNMEKRSAILEVERQNFNTPKFFSGWGNQKQLLTEQASGLFKIFMGLFTDPVVVKKFVGKTIDLNDGTYLLIKNVDESGFHGTRFKHSKTGTGKSMGEHIVPPRDLLDPTIVGPTGKIQKNIDAITNTKQMVAYLTNPISASPSYHKDLADFYKEFNSKLLGDAIESAEIDKIVMNMQNSGHVKIIMDVLEGVGEKGGKSAALTPKQFKTKIRNKMKEQGNMGHLSDAEIDDQIDFIIGEMDEINAGFSAKINNIYAHKMKTKDAPFFGKKPKTGEDFEMKVKTIDGEEIIISQNTDIDDVLKIDYFNDASKLKKIFAGPPDAATKQFIENFKYSDPNLLKKAYYGLKNYTKKFILQYPWPYQWLKGMYRTHLDFDYLWENGFRKWSDLEGPTKKYLTAKYGISDKTPGAVDSAGNLQILNPKINPKGNQVNSELFPQTKGWGDPQGAGGWRGFNNEYRNTLFGIFKSNVKYEYDKPFPYALQVFRNSIIPALFLGLYVKPSFTWDLIYKYFGLMKLEGGAREAALTTWSQAKTLSSEKCNAACMEQYKLENYDWDGNQQDEGFKEFKYDDEGWKSIAPCLAVYRKAYNTMNGLSTAELMPLIAQQWYAIKILKMVLPWEPDMEDPEELLNRQEDMKTAFKNYKNPELNKIAGEKL